MVALVTRHQVFCHAHFGTISGTFACDKMGDYGTGKRDKMPVTSTQLDTSDAKVTGAVGSIVFFTDIM